MKEPKINCEGIECNECVFEWRNAQYNPDCFLREFIDFAVKRKTIEEEIERLDEKMKEVMNDPELPKMVEEYQKKYGTISEEDMLKRFTI